MYTTTLARMYTTYMWAFLWRPPIKYLMDSYYLRTTWYSTYMGTYTQYYMVHHTHRYARTTPHPWYTTPTTTCTPCTTQG